MARNWELTDKGYRTFTDQGYIQEKTPQVNSPVNLPVNLPGLKSQDKTRVGFRPSIFGNCIVVECKFCKTQYVTMWAGSWKCGCGINHSWTEGNAPQATTR